MNDTETFHFGNVTVVVHWPDITDAEAARREQQVGDAMENYMRAYLARKKGAI